MQSDASLTLGRSDKGPRPPPGENKAKADFKLSGKLSEEQRTTESGVILKFVEPGDARKPVKKWLLYVFKNDVSLDPVYLRKSANLLGRDRAIADIPLDHPSCSSQHAVIQFRAVPVPTEVGEEPRKVIKYGFCA